MDVRAVAVVVRALETEEGLMDFAGALGALRAGQAVTRAGWNGKGMWLKLQVPDSGSKMSRPYLYMRTSDAGLVPWVASHTDLLASDWEVANAAA